MRGKTPNDGFLLELNEAVVAEEFYPNAYSLI